MFGMTLCNWNMEKLLKKDEVFAGLFDGSKCDVNRCFNCTYVPKGSKTPKSVKSVKVEKSMKSDKAKATKSEKAAKADESKASK